MNPVAAVLAFALAAGLESDVAGAGLALVVAEDLDYWVLLVFVLRDNLRRRLTSAVVDGVLEAHGLDSDVVERLALVDIVTVDTQFALILV